MRRRTFYIMVFLSLLTSVNITGQFTDTASIIINTRLSFYTKEKTAELLVRIPSPLIGSGLDITLQSGDSILNRWTGKPGEEIVSIPFNLSSCQASCKIKASVINNAAPAIMYTAKCDLYIIQHKANEVKIDRLTGGLIVHGLDYFPFGFYCYSPVHPALPEEEVVKGFNMISPYQKIVPETYGERKAYMDRCAQLGMKVNYNLISVSGGGGGVYSKPDGYSDQQKREMLINEIKAFMDHPALLAWYISDEPNGSRIPPEKIAEIYRVVKETDPWHPVSVVFMAPFTTAKKYAQGVDIVMADPYPVPDFPVTMAGDAAASLKKEFNGRKPVWIVPQAFGGGEHWKREPTVQEIRSMTWQSIIRGATGIQFFIRHGLNSFPKSTAVWNECGRIAAEINSLVPWLLSDEEAIPVRSSFRKVLVTSRMARGQLVIMAVNTVNEPVMADITIGINYSGRAGVIFENRSVRVSGGVITDYFPAFGSQVYKIDLEPAAETIKPWSGNLILDHSFEDFTSPGIPAACYAWTGDNRGATYFLDPRISVEGNYSLRLTTPVEGKSASIKFFPVKVKRGLSYLVSIWAKSDPEQRFSTGDHEKIGDKPEKREPQFAEAGMGEFGMSRFVPSSEWKQYVTIVTIPSDTLPEIKANVILRMPGQGVAWFDLLQVIEDPLNNIK